MMKEPRVFLIHILENIALVQHNVKSMSFDDFAKNKTIQDAVLREIEIIGEATKNIPIEFKEEHAQIPWKHVSGMRNRIVHEYFDIDLEVIWQTIVEDLPTFKKQIDVLLENIG